MEKKTTTKQMTNKMFHYNLHKKRVITYLVTTTKIIKAYTIMNDHHKHKDQIHHNHMYEEGTSLKYEPNNW